ncbi:MAG: hypothetical protein MZV49_13125 [Rhodopseudomonas palustris]|nr:hypothetical protein [Rhodopseudomonas palustris]
MDPLAEAHPRAHRPPALRTASTTIVTTRCAASASCSATLVARYYESQQFQPQWRDPARLDLLLDSHRRPAQRRPRSRTTTTSRRCSRTAPSCGRAKALPADEQADLELLATDAMMLGLYHLYLGKVDPEKLSSQWNFSSRPDRRSSAASRRSRSALDVGRDPRDLRARAAAARLVPARPRAPEGVPRASRRRAAGRAIPDGPTHQARA